MTPENEEVFPSKLEESREYVLDMLAQFADLARQNQDHDLALLLAAIVAGRKGS